MHWNWVATLGVALMLVAAGCGSSKPVTKMEFAKLAEAVCTRTSAEGAAILKDVIAQQSSQHLSEAQARVMFGQRVLALKKRQLKELETLESPDRLQTTFARWKLALRVEIKRVIGAVILTHAQREALAVFGSRRDHLKNSLGIRQECV